MGTKGLAHRFATALAVLRTRATTCLGLSALIACAGCNQPPTSGSPPTGSVDESLGNFASMSVWTDPDTGCRYYIYTQGAGNAQWGGITIRFRADGKPDCPGENTAAQVPTH